MSDIISRNASVLEYSSSVEWPLLHVLELLLGNAGCEMCTAWLQAPFPLTGYKVADRGDPNSVFCASVLRVSHCRVDKKQGFAAFAGWVPSSSCLFLTAACVLLGQIKFHVSHLAGFILQKLRKASGAVTVSSWW